MAYIPREHKHYNLLPFCEKNDIEVFEYPSDLLKDVDELLADGETLIPYGYKSYEEYYDRLDDLIEKFDNDNAKNLLDLFGNRMVVLNVKQTWTILKYIGETTDEKLHMGLTNSKYYYCPDPTPVHGMLGIIDDEEFTSYLYPCDSCDWILYEDPTGEASKILNQKPENDLMCPCCNKHYFLHNTDNICPVCKWEFDIIQHQRPDDDCGANSVSLNEARKHFNSKGRDLTKLYSGAFKSLSQLETELICYEFAIEKDVLFSLSERQLDCIYGILELIGNMEYENYNGKTKRYKSICEILTHLDNYFECYLGDSCEEKIK